MFFNSLGDFSSKQDSRCDRTTEFSSAGVAVVISSNQTPSQEWGGGVGIVLCGFRKKDLQIDLGPDVPGAQGSLQTCLLCVLLSAVLLSDC